MDDTHLCIRCNQVIIGLDNYIHHRRGNCPNESSVACSTSKQLDHSDYSKTYDFTDEELDDDEDFDEESEDEEEEDFDEAEDTQVHNVSNTSEEPRKNYDYDLGCADLFFSSLELQSSSKRGMMSTPVPKAPPKMLTRKATAALTSSHGDEWIDSTKMMKTVDEIGGGKKHSNEYPYYRQESPEVDQDDEESDEEYSNVPPRNYTRGKWRPESRAALENKFKPIDRPSTSSSRPPQNYTGGKWKPSERNNINWGAPEIDPESSNDPMEKSIETEERNCPPPSHTKGKWIPGTKITKLEYKEEKIFEKMAMERDHFWCSACNRKLTNRKVFERHLTSNLHSKRTKQQNELEEIVPARNMKEYSENMLQKHEDEIKKTCPDESTVEAETEVVNSATDCHESETDKIKKRFNSKTKILCELCNMRMPAHLFGKHLISMFHYRKMLQNPSKSFDIVLNNFHKIIIQSPFQCQPCRFYFNTQEMFLKHWHSIEHADNIKNISGKFKFLCSFCKFECIENEEMAEHLIGSEHQQVVSVINRSRPIVIKMITPLVCSYCQQRFRYNIQLMQHLKHCQKISEVNEPSDSSSSLFKLESKFFCTNCKKIFQSGLSLQKHKLKIHQISIFFCSYCQLTFKTTLEAKQHRRTSQHKILSTRKRMLSGSQDSSKLLPMKKICPVCNEEKLDLLDLKHHIRDFHPEHRHSCSFCGQSFIFSQEVACHVRDKKCQFYNLNKSNEFVESASLKNISTTTATRTSTTGDTTSNFGQSSSNSISNVNEKTEKKVLVTTTATTTATSSVSTSSESNNNSSGNMFPNLDMTLIDTYILSDTAIMAPPTPLTNESGFFHANPNPTAKLDDDDILSALQNQDNAEIKFKCKLCSFSTQSHAEFLFHEILHDVPVDQKSVHKIECPYCKKSFRKQSLRDHLRQHTNERIFQCNFCPMKFTRKANLKNHIENIHSRSRPTDNEALFICTICGKKFRNKYILEQHQHVHRHQIETKTFPCQIENCVYIGRNTSDMKSHLLTHSDEKNFSCDYSNCDYKGQNMEQLRSHWKKHQESEKKYACQHCDYKTKLSSHLRRHELTHTTEKPFKCAYCSYSCNSSENLRKHVISTTKHKGRFMYECQLCDANDIFKTNVTKEYNSHLSQAHNVENVTI